MYLHYSWKSLNWKLEYLKLKYDAETDHMKNTKPLLQKFYDFIDNLRKKELIYLTVYNSFKELNAEKLAKNPELPDSKLAAGTYVFLKPEHDDPFARLKFKLPRINILTHEAYLEEYPESDFSPMRQVWTYAHELGHHFAIKEKNDYTEETADAYISKFAHDCFTHEELVILKIPIEIYSGIKYDNENYKIEYDLLINKLVGCSEQEFLHKKDKKYLLGLGLLLRRFAKFIDRIGDKISERQEKKDKK